MLYTLYDDDDVEFVFDIQECNLHVSNVVVSPQTIVSHTTTFAINKPAMYPIQRSFLKVFSIPQAALHWQGESLFGNRIPNTMYVVLIKTKDLQGNKKGNPYTFYHHNVSSIAFYRDSRVIGGEVLEMMDFAGNYVSFLEAYNRLFFLKGNEPNISRDDFRLGYTIFVHKSSTNMSGTLPLLTQAELSLLSDWTAVYANHYFN